MILEEFNRLPDAVRMGILAEFAQIDRDVEGRVDTFLAQAVVDADSWHPKQALIGWAERRHAAEEIAPLMVSVGSGVGLAIAQGALVAAGVAAGAVSFGIIPVAGIVAGLIISQAKSEYHHYASGKRLHTGIKALRAKRAAMVAANQQQGVSFGDSGYQAELKAVMNEAGEKINRKYLRVARIGKGSTFLRRSGSPHLSEATAADKLLAAGLLTAAWKDGNNAKDDSLALAVLELHFYASTVFQELAQFLDWISTERTTHLNKMARLRGHIVRQMHVSGKHDNCATKCGNVDMATLEQRCQEIVNKIHAAAQREVDQALAIQASRAAARDSLLAQRVSLQGDSDALMSRKSALLAQKAGLQDAINRADPQRNAFTAHQAGAQLKRRYELIDTNKALVAIEAEEAKWRAKSQENELALRDAISESTTASALLVTQQAVLSSLKTNDISAAGTYVNTVQQSGWTRTTINSARAIAEVGKLKSETDVPGDIAGNEVVGVGVDYGLDVAMDQLGNVVEEVANKAANISTAVGVGAVIEVSIEALKDLYENRQLVRRLHAFGRARETPWVKLSDVAKEDAMKDLEKIGLQRESLDKVGYRVGHYLDKIAAIDTQISELQAQAPYSDMFKEEVFANSIFSSCTDAINTWYLCCYKDKQYAKLESSILAFQMLLMEMETKLSAASHGAVVTVGQLVRKSGPPAKPSYFSKMD